MKARMAVVVAAGILIPVLSRNTVVLAADGDGVSRLPELVDEQIVKAVARGLDHLARLQQPDGKIPGKWGSPDYPATLTSLTGLAFLASGSTPSEGVYADNVRRAMRYLMKLGDSHPDGLIAGKTEGRCTYGHGFSMLFLAQCYGQELTPDDEQGVKYTLDRAIKLSALGQSTAGGWIYTPIGGGGEEGSTTACMLQGLRACRAVGLKVPTETIQRTVKYLRQGQNPDGGISYSSISPGASLLPISTAAIVCFYSAGIYDRKAGGDGEAVFVDKLWRYVDERAGKFMDAKGYQIYMNFYLAQAKFQRGGMDWEDYYRKVSRYLVSAQQSDGSWQGEDVAPAYGTSVACMILQMPYGYLPIADR